MFVFRTDAHDKCTLKNSGKLNLSLMSVLPHDIRDIYGVCCGGAYGDTNQWSTFVYGTRPDDKTVRCRVTYFQRDLSEGIDVMTVFVWSKYKTDKNSVNMSVCTSVFQLEDWHKSSGMDKEDQKEYLNNILKERRIAAYQSLR